MKRFLGLTALACLMTSFAATPDDTPTTQPAPASRPAPNPSATQPHAKTLGEQLWDMECLQKGKDTPFDQVEAMAESLLKEHPAPPDQARIYYQLAIMYAQSGPVCDATIRTAKVALDLPLEPPKRLQLYVYWGYVIQIQNSRIPGNDRTLARKEAARIYFKGLKECADQKIPKDKPVLATWRITNRDGPETEETRRIKSEMQANAAENETKRFQIAMIEHRDTLVKQLVDMYTRAPFATQELQALARDALGNSWLVDELIKQVKMKIPKPPPPTTNTA
jgi:hypothetical protein